METATRMTVARGLAVIGTVLVGFPLAAPIGLMVAFLVAGGGFHFDFLMPGELFFLALAGGVVLFAASLIARRRRWLIGVSLGAAVLLFAVTSGSAIWTGLASGRTEAAGWPLAVVAGSYGLYVAAVIVLLVAGVLLCRDVFRRGSAA